MYQEDDHFTVIARLDERNYIVHCEHGVIYLTWGMSTLRFLPQGFIHVARLLEQGVIGVTNRKICDGEVCLIQDENGGFVLMIKDFGLRLDSTDFLLLVDLVRTALQRIGYIHADESNLTLRKYSRTSFSLN